MESMQIVRLLPLRKYIAGKARRLESGSVFSTRNFDFRVATSDIFRVSRPLAGSDVFHGLAILESTSDISRFVYTITLCIVCPTPNVVNFQLDGPDHQVNRYDITAPRIST
mmetsp:Transcript_25351/g.48537  ORF Transcript_25351/g.48537 Transcript_25351/m.48537 type:complete len:111 (-) Transcript_25351:47-379(-)